VEPLEVVLRLDDARVGGDPQAKCFRRGHGSFLRARQWRGHQVDDLRTVSCTRREVLGKHAGHIPAPFGEVEFGQPTIQDAIGIMDFAMAEQMDSCVGHVYQFLKDTERSEIFYR
jgi:hypothetical protein